MWAERDKRKESGTSISTLLNGVILEKNRTYLRSIAEIIIFLAVNELPFRGKQMRFCLLLCYLNLDDFYLLDV